MHTWFGKPRNKTFTHSTDFWVPVLENGLEIEMCASNELMVMQLIVGY